MNMKKQLRLTIMIFVIGLSAKSQNLKKVETYYDPYTKTKIHEAYTTLPTPPYPIHGVYKEWDQSGVLMKEITFQNGKKHGPYKVFINAGMASIWGKENVGKLYSVTNYSNDKLNGVDQMYSYKNGKAQIVLQKTWLNEKQVKEEAWTDDGNPIKLIQPDGPCFENYESGGKRFEYTLKAGKFEGKYTSWYPDGKVEVSTNYKDDKKNGKHIEYGKNGKPEFEATFVNDKMSGVVTLWYPDGTVRKTVYYDPVTFNLVEEKEFSTKGVLKFHRSIVSGNKTKAITYDSISGTRSLEEEELSDPNTGKYVKHGRVIQYWSNGAVALEAQYQNGKLNGNYKQLDPEGEIVSSGETKDGRTVGEWIFYYDEEFNQAESKKDASFYRKINYNSQEGPWPTTDYFISGGKQFEGFLAGVSPDVPAGKCKYYFENGKISQDCEFNAKGKPLSLKIFDEEGTLLQEGTAVDPKAPITMNWIEYYPNGKVKAKGILNPTTGIKIATWTYYDEAGNAREVLENQR
jgi:antitoxin component YwqK of YwqJK toxin-antitoxin module